MENYTESQESYESLFKDKNKYNAIMRAIAGVYIVRCVHKTQITIINDLSMRTAYWRSFCYLEKCIFI
ncbi:MAG: hypothetical protein K5677_03530 [Ruminococcus sp.]|nr:hypothetical protein [Ruminococcus sp.]